MTYVRELIPGSTRERRDTICTYTVGQQTAFANIMRNENDFKIKCARMGAQGIEEAGLAGVCALMREMENTSAVGVGLVAAPGSNPGASLAAALAVSPRSLPLGVSAAIMVTQEGDVAVLGIDYRGVPSLLETRCLRLFYKFDPALDPLLVLHLPFTGTIPTGDGRIFFSHTIPAHARKRSITAATLTVYRSDRA